MTQGASLRVPAKNKKKKEAVFTLYTVSMANKSQQLSGNHEDFVAVPYVASGIVVVFQVKFLRSKEGSAMIQMGDNVSCDRAIKMLNGAVFYGSKMQLG